MKSIIEIYPEVTAPKPIGLRDVIRHRDGGTYMVVRGINKHTVALLNLSTGEVENDGFMIVVNTEALTVHELKKLLDSAFIEHYSRLEPQEFADWAQDKAIPF